MEGRSMHEYVNVRPRAVFTLLLLVASAVSIAACSSATDGDSQEFEGVVVTGLNRLFGEPIFNYPFMPAPFAERFGFEMLGVYNEGGPDPLPLTAETPDTAVLATLVDADGVGPPPAILQNFDAALINVPLRDVKTWVLPPNLEKRASVPPHLVGPIVGATQSEPAGPITKGDWFKASGTVTINCNPGGHSVNIDMRSLIPNRLYTVWAIWLVPGIQEHGEGPPQPHFIPTPLGGTPNSYVTDKNGDATFERELSFCPVDAAREGVDGNILASLETHLHSDHTAYGGVPAPLAAGYPPGTVLHGHLNWNLGAGERRN